MGWKSLRANFALGRKTKQIKRGGRRLKNVSRGASNGCSYDLRVFAKVHEGGLVFF